MIEVDPDLATPFKKWLAKFFQGVFPSFCIGSLQAELVTRDKDQVQKVSNKTNQDKVGYSLMSSSSFEPSKSTVPGTNLSVIYLFQKSHRRPWTSIGGHLLFFIL